MNQQTLNFDGPKMPKLVGADLLVAEHILAATAKSPASIEYLQEMVRATAYGEIDERRIKKVAERLRDAGFIVCAYRNKTKGYYIPKTAEEIRDGLRGYLAQSVTQIKKVMRLLRSQGYAEIAGQMRLECEAALKEE